MWFPLSLLALTMLVARRSQEKLVANNISSSAMAWLQQAIALPFIVGTLFFAKFYWPWELSSAFWLTMIAYVIFGAVDLYCYFKAISLADISYVAPLLSLVAVGNVVGAYFVLGQVPSVLGVIGVGLIVFGAFLINDAKRKDKANLKKNKLALMLVLLLVVVRGYYANIEVPMLRETNPTTFNFYTSVLTVPFILLISTLAIKNQKSKYKNYWPNLRIGVKKYQWALLIVGITYTINLLATYQAKLISPNAGYVGAVKSASVLPMVFIGLFFFKEKIVKQQWFGLVLIMFGLAALGMN